MCLYPQLIENPKYKANKKNNGKPPPLQDQRIKYVPVGCQQCLECRKQKSNSWRVRILEDIKQHKNGKFITFTFSNESIKLITDAIQLHCTTNNIKLPTDYEMDNTIATYATRHFLERYRKQYKSSLRHWLVTELGHNGTENIHLHGIIWTDIPLTTIEKIWQYGFIWKGHQKWNHKTKEYYYENYVNEATVNYITKYIFKADEKHKFYKPIILSSPGIGNRYINTENAKRNKFNANLTNDTYRTSTGHKTTLPIYYRNKLYTEQQREQLWLNKLDKQERWVLGTKISIKENEFEYQKALKYAQKQNVKLGYINLENKKLWEEQRYERQRRKLMQEKRIQADQSASRKTNGGASRQSAKPKNR